MLKIIAKIEKKETLKNYNTANSIKVYLLSCKV